MSLGQDMEESYENQIDWHTKVDCFNAIMAKTNTYFIDPLFDLDTG